MDRIYVHRIRIEKYMKKYPFYFFCFFLAIPLLANMASPIQEGSRVGAPFLHENVEILREQILVRPDADFWMAEYQIRYEIRVLESGTQIPMLFVAAEYRDSFRVRFAGQEVPVQPLPQAYWNEPDRSLSGFLDLPRDSSSYGDNLVEIQWSDNYGGTYRMDELLYFELDMPVGEHVIEVSYRALAWEDNLDWVAVKSFPYLLSPARYWRSFGELEIIVDARDCPLPLQTNLGPPDEGSLDNRAAWYYEDLPADRFELIYHPEPNATARTLIAIGPTGLARIAAIIFVGLHLLLLWQYRRRDPRHPFPVVLWLGMIFFPIFVIGAYVSGFGLIKSSLGADASNQFGYYFLSWLGYPVLLIGYGIFMLIIDRLFFRRKNKLE